MDGSIALPTAAGVELSRLIEPGGLGWKADALSLYQQCLPAEFFDQLCQQEGFPQNRRVYTAGVVIWLMITQRLHGNGSMETAVMELLRGLPTSFWPQPCKRLQGAELGAALSSHTGAYNKARQQLPAEIVHQAYDRMVPQLMELTGGGGPTLGRRAFLFDGTTVRLPHRPELCQLYPPGSNQHGESHWPLSRMVVAHDLETGLALPPASGPCLGPRAVSEQELFERLLPLLPERSLVLGDGNFGVFSVAYTAKVGHGQDVLLRLTLVRAQRLARERLRHGIDQPVTWRPTRADRRSHPELPGDACVRGRLIVWEVVPSNGSGPFLLCLFTTVEWAFQPEEVVAVYGRRWDIELDLRPLKGTLRLDELSCTTANMVDKEIQAGMIAYNLVRAVTYVAAKASGLRPRDYSFTRVRNVIQAFAPLIETAPNEEQAQKLVAKMMHYVRQARLPRRKTKRPSYPRAVWPRGASFPRRKA